MILITFYVSFIIINTIVLNFISAKHHITQTQPNFSISFFAIVETIFTQQAETHISQNWNQLPEKEMSKEGLESKKKKNLRMYYAGKALGNDMVWFLHCHKAGVQISVYPYRVQWKQPH